ncbi:MAG: peptidoglycan editing factor PgeF [Bacteroidia bacterium]|nr:peptidoglycan editing factor PgeF [Bacteroidia bacterium]
MWLQAPNIKCKHAFSTRTGGISEGVFESLNLGGSDDLPENILANRKLFLKNIGLDFSKLCYLKQIHSNIVCEAVIGQVEGDALVTNKPGLVLAVSIADCYPILFCDFKNKVIGAAHAGWRGTVSKIAENTLNKMIELGAEKNHIQVAIGQGICKNNFEVGNEVIAQFKNAGFPSNLLENKHIDLAACNEYVLVKNGIKENQIWKINRCTFEKDFFSYRRDKGNTGRMWAVISI